MAKYKIEVDKKTCIGCSACVAQSDNFVMDEANNVSVPVKKEISDKEYQAIKEIAEGCPVNAIKIIKKK